MSQKWNKVIFQQMVILIFWKCFWDSPHYLDYFNTGGNFGTFSVVKATLQPPRSVHSFICPSVSHQNPKTSKNQSFQLTMTFTTSHTITHTTTQNITHITQNFVQNITHTTFKLFSLFNEYLITVASTFLLWQLLTLCLLIVNFPYL